MKINLSGINLILILFLFLFLGWSIYSWLQPNFPATVKGDEIVPTPRVLNVPVLSRKAYSKAVVGEVTRLNLFRKERKNYYRPQPPKPKPWPELHSKSGPPKPVVTPFQKPTVPPTKLILTGVMLLGDHEVAIFEGTYSEIREGRLTQNIKPRRRGYKVGESLGGYKIANINKTHATLTVIGGNPLILKISKTPPDAKIKKTDHRLVQKSKPVLTDILVKPSARGTRRSKPIPIAKSPLNGVFPPVNSLSDFLTPGTKSPAPASSNPIRLPRLRQETMGF